MQVLVLDQGRLAGILTPKDVLMRVVAKEIDPDRTPVSSIMTPNPDTVPPEMTAVEALGEVCVTIDFCVRGMASDFGREVKVCVASDFWA